MPTCPASRRFKLLHDQCKARGRKGDHRTARKIDAAGDDDHRRAQGKDTQENRLAQQLLRANPREFR